MGKRIGKGKLNNYKEKETGRKKQHSCNTICYGNNFEKYELIKRKEGVMAKAILKVNQVVFTASKHTVSAVVFRPALEF